MQVLHQGGGAGSVTSTLHLSLGLQEAGVAIRFVCPPDSEVEELARENGLDVHPLALHPRRRRANAAALAGLLKQYPVDLVNSQSSRDRKALTWLGLRRGLAVPLLATRRQMPRTFYLENWIASRVAARMIAVSEAVARALRSRGTPARKLSVIPNGLVTARVDTPVAPAALEAWEELIGWTPAQRTIGIVARPKDQGLVLEALPLLSAPVRLVLAGVDAGSSLGRRAAEVRPPHSVVCVPFTSDVRPLYDLLEIVLLPSRSEGLSQSLLEAMALGKPVIASDSSSNPEVVQNEVNGLLVSPRDPAAWARAMNFVLANPTLAARLGEAARDTARRTFSLERTVDRTLRLYHAVLHRAPLAPTSSPT